MRRVPWRGTRDARRSTPASRASRRCRTAAGASTEPASRRSGKLLACLVLSRLAGAAPSVARQRMQGTQPSRSGPGVSLWRKSHRPDLAGQRPPLLLSSSPRLEIARAPAPPRRRRARTGARIRPADALPQCSAKARSRGLCVRTACSAGATPTSSKRGADPRAEVENVPEALRSAQQGAAALHAPGFACAIAQFRQCGGVGPGEAGRCRATRWRRIGSASILRASSQALVSADLAGRRQLHCKRQLGFFAAAHESSA